MIELRAVWKGFGNQSILEDINLSIADGERLCVIGQSGIGKSVMLKLITGLLTVDHGEIWIDGKDVTRFQEKDWNKLLLSFGVVFQSAALFDSLSVYENVGIRLIEERTVKLAEIKERVAESLLRVGLDPAEVMHKFPAELSGGMQKRVGVARAIVNRPKYIFYDEPTTGLDPVNSGRIDDLMQTLAAEHGRTSIIITHDMYTVKTIATKVAFIHDRKLHFHGTPAELMASDDLEIKRFLARI